MNIIFFFLPLILLLAKRNKVYFLFGLFYLSLWLMFFVIVIAMKRLPFERNLIGHYSLSLAGVLLVVHWLVGVIKKGWPAKILKWVLFPVVLILFTLHFINTNETYLKETLYEYDVNKMWKFKNDQLAVIPSGSTVAFSESEFYSCYICRKKGCQVSKCANGNEEYYVKHESEKLLPGSENRYFLLNNNDGYEIYKRK